MVQPQSLVHWKVRHRNCLRLPQESRVIAHFMDIEQYAPVLRTVRSRVGIATRRVDMTSCDFATVYGTGSKCSDFCRN